MRKSLFSALTRSIGNLLGFRAQVVFSTKETANERRIERQREQARQVQSQQPEEREVHRLGPRPEKRRHEEGRKAKDVIPNPVRLLDRMPVDDRLDAFNRLLGVDLDELDRQVNDQSHPLQGYVLMTYHGNQADGLKTQTSWYVNALEASPATYLVEIDWLAWFMKNRIYDERVTRE